MEARALTKAGVLQVRWHDRLAAMPVPMPDQMDVSDKVEGMLLVQSAESSQDNRVKSE